MKVIRQILHEWFSKGCEVLRKLSFGLCKLAKKRVIQQARKIFVFSSISSNFFYLNSQSCPSKNKIRLHLADQKLGKINSRPEKRTVSHCVYSKNLCSRKMGTSWNFLITINNIGTLFHTLIHPFF